MKRMNHGPSRYGKNRGYWDTVHQALSDGAWYLFTEEDYKSRETLDAFVSTLRTSMNYRGMRVTVRRRPEGVYVQMTVQQ